MAAALQPRVCRLDAAGAGGYPANCDMVSTRMRTIGRISASNAEAEAMRKTRGCWVSLALLLTTSTAWSEDAVLRVGDVPLTTWARVVKATK